MINTDNIPRVIPNSSALSAETLPEGIGRFFVLSMSRSMSLSYHIFIAPADPEPRATHIRDISTRKGCILPGAVTIPATAVNTTRYIILGFSKRQKSSIVDSTFSKTLVYILFYHWWFFESMKRRW
ncbi:hypothetical protein N500_0533 [Wolbachia pipientis wUni]|nr:hypothetical protein N500_0533 [Wolbachia pipientis wUni]